MLQLRNRSGLACSLAVWPDVDGIDTLIIAAAGAYSFAGTALPAAVSDRDDDGDGDGIEPALGLPKPGTDVLLRGHSYAAGGSAPTCDATLSVSAIHGRLPLRKTVRVFGDRVWRRSCFRLRASAPAAFARMPLEWRRAAGGSAMAADGSSAGDDRNPEGVGFRASGQRVEAGDPLPNLERPDELIASWRDRPAPAGFGAVEAHWQPRRAWAGTYDETWTRTRAPYLPLDFDRRFLQLAPSDQVVAGHLTGSEEVELGNLTPSGRAVFRLPGIAPAVTVRIGGSSHACRAQLDTVAIRPDDGVVELLWRAAWPCDKRALGIERIDVDLATSEA